MLFHDRICAVVAASTAREMAAQVRAALRATRTIELRLDWLAGQAERRKFLRWLNRHRPAATFVATCRPRFAGGRFTGKAPATDLLHAATLGCLWCDLEVETAEQFHRGFARKLVRPARCLLSYHNFARTPAGLRAIVQRLERAGADAIKIASRCHTLGDSLRILSLARGRRSTIAVPMGNAGLPARVLALAHGSALAYAAVSEKTAPGQLTLREMIELYGVDKLTRRTRVYGVIGDPVGHSLSPVLHNAGYRARRINAVYLPFLVRDLKDFLAAVEPLGIRGFSVTLPHKERILRHLDGCDPLAEKIGAVNTVVVRGSGELYGYNTDYVGVLRALERKVRLAGSRVLLYGAGGAARAVAFALRQAGAVVSVCARRPQRAESLARSVGGEMVERVRLRREFFDAIVNTTPVGMHPRQNESPLAARELNCRLVFDLIYRPVRTKLLRLAERKGVEIVTGLEMFIAQGSAQWEIWTGERAPERAMRRAVEETLKGEAGKQGRREAEIKN